MATINYIPKTVAFIESNLPIVENGHIIGDTVERTPLIIDGIVWVLKKVGGFIAEQGTQLDPIFSLICIIGIFIIMAGFKKLGTKITSASILGYIACKVVSEAC